MATDRASLGSFLLDFPVPSTRTLEAKVAGWQVGGSSEGVIACAL